MPELTQGFKTADKNLKEIYGHKTESTSSGSAVKTGPVYKVIISDRGLV